MKIFKKLKWALLLALIMALTLVGVALATVTVIDHFDSNQSLTVTYEGVTISDVDSLVDTDVLGGERDIFVSIVAGNGGQSVLVTVNNSGDSVLTITSGTNIRYYVEIQYDGTADSPKDVIDTTTGLTGAEADLTLGGTRDRIIIGIPFTDLGGPVGMRVYSSDTACTERFVTPGPISYLKPQLFEYALDTSGVAAICPGYTEHADFTDARAVVIVLDARSLAYASTDMNFHLVGSTFPPYLDYGDLPATYDVDYLGNTGDARHIITDVKLGPTTSSVDAENAKRGEDAVSDNFDDGVVRLGSIWTPGNTEQVQISVTDCPNVNCYVDAWVDWNGDGNFWDGIDDWDANEKVLENYSVTNGNQNVNISVPGTVTLQDGTFYARFRISDRPTGDLGTAWWVYYSGEIEDYRWDFGPTAVSLINLDAQNKTPLIIIAAGVLLLLSSAGAILVYKRSRS